MPKTRSEKEIAGYRDVLATIHENYEYIPVSSNMILQLHRDLYKYSGNGYGGNFKSTDNVIAEELPDGTKRVRFEPVPAWETAEAINNLCASFKNACNMQMMDVLLLLPMFILDFLCIHPFNDDVIIRTKLRKPNKIKGLHDLVLFFLCSGRRSSTIPFLAFCLKVVHILLANNMQKKYRFHLEAIKATKSSEG